VFWFLTVVQIAIVLWLWGRDTGIDAGSVAGAASLVMSKDVGLILEGVT
jgi:hypothetical protein